MVPNRKANQERQLCVGFRRVAVLLLMGAACTGGTVRPAATRIPPASTRASPSTESTPGAFLTFSFVHSRGGPGSGVGSH